MRALKRVQMIAKFKRRRPPPLTTRAIRERRIAEDNDARPTPLDVLLTDEEADALEEYAWCKTCLEGVARTIDYSGDRVQTARSAMTLLPDGQLARLRTHVERRLLLPPRTRSALDLFVEQQECCEGVPSDAQIGLTLDPHDSTPADSWRQIVVVAARTLVRTAAIESSGRRVLPSAPPKPQRKQRSEKCFTDDQ
jgi:hypothetical protein